MVKIGIGDIFKSQCQTLVNTVNCVGVMGKGLALEFKRRFPDMYEDYARRCRAGEVKLCAPYLYRGLALPWVLSFPTKEHWRSVARLADIVCGLEHLENHYRQWGITSLAVPPLGCGLGQLEWRVVGRTLYRHLNRLDIPVELYAPPGTPCDELQPAFLEQDQTAGMTDEAPSPERLKPAWVALVEILSRIEREPHHWPVGRTTFQKIAYFATESGIPTGLQFERGSYGPYSFQLKGLVTRLVNNGLIAEERRGRMFTVRVGPTFPDARSAYGSELDRWSSKIDRSVDLFMRMRTRQAEIAATVHFVAKSLSAQKQQRPSEMDVLTEVMRWKQNRQPRVDELEVALAVRNLSMLGWLDVGGSRDLPVPDPMPDDE
jgi:O-acetyl-ADP-ribose deacetylase (regulator of RNase III)